MANNAWVWKLFTIVDENAQEPEVKCKSCPYSMLFLRTRNKDIVSRSLVTHIHGHHPRLEPKPAKHGSKGPQFSHWIWIHFTLGEDRMATCNYCGHQLQYPKGKSPTYLVKYAPVKHGKNEMSGRSETVPSASTSSTVIEIVEEEQEENALDNDPVNNTLSNELQVTITPSAPVNGVTPGNEVEQDVYVDAMDTTLVETLQINMPVI